MLFKSVSSLKYNVAWTFLGNAIYSACQWGVLMALAKLTNVATVGQFSLALAVSGPVYSFFNLQLRNIVATDMANEFHFRDYLGVRLCSTMLAILIIAMISTFFMDKYETFLVIVFIGLAKGVESLTDILYGFFQKHELMKTIAISYIFRGMIAFFFVVVSILATKSIVIASVAFFVGYLLFFICDFNRLKKVYVSVHNEQLYFKNFQLLELKKIVLISIPMGFVILLNTLNMNIPKYLIVHYFNESTLGYYSAISYLIVVGATIVNAIGQSALPRLARYYANDIYVYKSVLYKILGLTVLLSFILILGAHYLGGFFLTLIYSEEYAKYSDILFWVMVSGGALFCSAIMGCAITATRSFWTQFSIGLAVSGTIAVCSIFLIPQLGMLGGVISLGIGFLVKLIIQSVFVLKLLHNKM